MKRVCVLQKYLMPYRVPLFNAIAKNEDIDFTALYYGKREQRRMATIYPDKAFRETQARVMMVWRSYNRNIEIPWNLYQELRSLAPDVVICAPDIGGVTAVAYSRRTGADVLIWSEETPVSQVTRGRLRKPLRKLLYSMATGFVVPGELAAEYIRSLVSGGRIHFANNSIQNETTFALTEGEVKAKFKREFLQLTFSGSLIPRKGIQLLLEAFHRLMERGSKHHPSCVLRILGEGPQDLRRFARDNVVFEGFREGREYADLMKSSHVFVLPSLHDCNPLTIIEALFAGNVVIASDGVGNHLEAVQGNGLVVPRGSVAAIAQGLEYVLTAPREHLTEMALNSLALSRNFTTERSAAGFLSAISSAAAG